MQEKVVLFLLRQVGDNGKLYEICVTILNLNVSHILTETSFESIILLKKQAQAVQRLYLQNTQERNSNVRILTLRNDFYTVEISPDLSFRICYLELFTFPTILSSKINSLNNYNNLYKPINKKLFTSESSASEFLPIYSLYSGFTNLLLK